MAEGAPAAPPAENLPTFNPGEAQKPASLGPAADSEYTTQAAKIEFQLNNALAGDREIFTNAAYAYNKALANYNRNEPIAVGTQRFRAALGGYANSGTEARDQGNIRAGYLEKRTGALGSFTQATNRANRLAQEATGAYNANIGLQVGAAENRYKNRQVKLGPQEPQPPQPFPAQAGSTVPGGGYPNIPVGPRGFATAEYGVGQGTDKPMRGTRLAAANKARKR